MATNKMRSWNIWHSAASRSLRRIMGPFLSAMTNCIKVTEQFN